MSSCRTVIEISDDEEDLSASEPNLSSQVLLRNDDVKLPLLFVSQCRMPNGRRLMSGDCVELGRLRPEYTEKRDGDFLKVCKIIQDLQTDKIVALRGIRFRRCTQMSGMLSRKINEVCAVLSVDRDDPRHAFDQGQEDVDLADAFKKRKLIITNTEFYKYSYRDHTNFVSSAANGDDHYASIHGSSELVCRWVYITEYENEIQRRNAKNVAGDKNSQRILRKVRETEADVGYSTSDALLSRSWRESLQPRQPPFTFCDGFCGGGGVSQGAADAGLSCVYAFDNNKDACYTYQLNRPESATYVAAVCDFLKLATNKRIDILHCSPPCQTHSIMHTHFGRNDDDNDAALFAVGDLIKKFKPRAFTLEETDGILRSSRIEWFYRVINMLTCHGYSVRWKKLKVVNFGVPQSRSRLVVVAACPGGVLPDFPKPTHGPPGSGLLPYKTIADAIDVIDSRTHTWHNLERTIARDLVPYDSATQCSCVLTSGLFGSRSYHPSGKRDFTVRELAALQGFPLDYEFGPNQNITSIKKQIGNAVPPVVMERIYDKIKKALMREDRERGGRA